MPILLRILVAGLPLIILPGVLFHYETTPKIALLALATAIALLGVQAIADSIPALWSRRSGRWLCGLALAQMLWLGLSTALSSRPWFSLLGANWRRMGLLTLLALIVFIVLAAAHFCAHRDAITGVLRVFAVSTIVASVYGIGQYFDIDPFQTASAYHAQAGDSTITRPPGTLAHADFFGWWLAIALFCGLATSRAETGAWRAVSRVACILSGVAIVFTGTRSAMLAVLAGFVFLALRIRHFKLKPLLTPWHFAAATLLIVIPAAFYLSPAGTRLRARVQWSADEPLGGARPLLWRDSLRMAAVQPLTGFGPEMFTRDFPRYQSTELARQFPDFYHESPHNTALDALTSEGLPGLLLAVGWIALGAYAASRPVLRESPLAAPLTAALLASCVASMFAAITLVPLFATGIVLAMLVAMLPADGPPRLKLRPVVVMAAALPVALCLAVYGVALTASDFRLAVFQHSPNPDASGAYNSLVQMELPGAAEDLYCARRLMSMCGTITNPVHRGDCWRAASWAAVRATNSDDNPPNAWYNLAIFAAATNDPSGVEKALRSASALAPNWFKPHWALAKMLALTGHPNEARKEAERASFLDGGKDADVTETLRNLTVGVR